MVINSKKIKKKILPWDYSLHAQFGINLKFWGHNCIFIICYWLAWLMWLVWLIPLPASSFTILLTAYTILGQWPLFAYHNNTPCPHPLKPQKYVLLTLIFLFLCWGYHHCPWVLCLNGVFLNVIQGWQWHPLLSSFVTLVIITTKHNNTTLAECNFFPFGNSVQICCIVKQIN